MAKQIKTFKPSGNTDYGVCVCGSKEASEIVYIYELKYVCVWKRKREREETRDWTINDNLGF